MRVNLVCGSTGAGKSTFARALADDRQAVRFSIDEWMSNLYWPDQAPGEDYRWAIERVERCERQIWATCCEILSRDRDVILDLGFTERKQRDRFRTWAEAVGVPTVTHFVTADIEVRRSRVRKRNEGEGETFAFEVTDEMFDFMEGIFEPPTEAETSSLEIVKT
ncbi:MAG: ATP-binding protein [Rhodobiaceae bacterium]|nr:ATP-binding protein [Rhodobiaceae bacterium]